MQLLLILGAVVLMTKPLGVYLVHVLDPEEEGGTFLEPVMGPVERLIYRVLRVQPSRGQTWIQYTVSVLTFSALTAVVTYVLLRLQDKLPLNPQNLPAVTPHLAFNTAVSFVTNTNWQSYGGESTMSYFSQMVALVMHHFFSAAAGIAIAAALVRGIARTRGKTIGNFWRDMTRLILHLLLPLALVYAVFLVWTGDPQNFMPYSVLTTVDQSTAASATEAAQETIAQGPIASMISIKMIGTNGGGYMNANSAHPFENANALGNYVQMVIFIWIASALTYYLGRMVRNQRHGWAVWSAMFAVMLAGILVCWYAETAGNPLVHAAGVAVAPGNMEGKEVRFGVFNSATWAAMTTATTCGAVNSMHDSFTPLGGLVPLINMQLGEVIFGGVGSGLYGMLVFVFVAIFIAGLMIGRTPEYLGKKIEARDVKLASLFVLVTCFAVLVPTAWASVSDWGMAGLNNNGPRGLGEILYYFSSASGNNGSAFAGLTTNTPWYNTLGGIVILVGRYFMIIPVLALAGSLVQKRAVAQSAGSFPVSGGTFVVLLVSTILIVGALTFFPVLALSPVVEHFLMHGGSMTF
jgi:K+-transporting ATPase ATPase A chain